MGSLDLMDALAVIVATVAAFAFGAAFYGALAESWMKAARISPDHTKMSASLFIGSFVLQLVVAVGLLLLLSAVGVATVGGALLTGLATAAAFAVAPMAINHRYQGFGADLTVIDSLHWLAVFSIIAVVLQLVR